MRTRPRPATALRRGVAALAGRTGVLYAGCAALAAAEAAVVYLTGFVSALPLAPQVVAPGPFGAYHDLRWVVTFGSSWPAVAWELVALLAFRTALTVALAALAWPASRPRPPIATLARRSALQTLFAVVVLSPWAALSFAASAVSYSWFMLGSVIALGVTAAVLPSPLADGGWWRRLLAWRAMLFVLATWVVLMAESAAIEYSPGAVAILAAAVSGAVNAMIWQRQTAATVRAPAARRRLPLAPLAVSAALALFLVGGSWVIGRGRVGGGGDRSQAAGVGIPHGVPVLYVPGYDSSFDGRPYRLLGTTVWHFSYRGMAGEGRPAAYTAGATHQPLGVSAHRLAAQVQTLSARAGRPVVLIADSEGSLVTRVYLQQHPTAPVRMLIELSPLMRPGRVYLPPAGGSGFGVLGGAEVRGLLELAGDLGDTQMSPDEPFVRSVLDDAARLRGSTMCPAGQVPVYAFVPFEGALTVWARPVSRVPWTAVPGYHATLLGDPTVQGDVAQLIRTGRMPTHAKSTAAFPLISAAAAAWQVPALPLSMRDAWQAPDDADPAFAGWQCPS